MSSTEQIRYLKHKIITSLRELGADRDFIYAVHRTNELEYLRSLNDHIALQKEYNAYIKTIETSIGLSLSDIEQVREDLHKEQEQDTNLQNNLGHTDVHSKNMSNLGVINDFYKPIEEKLDLELKTSPEGNFEEISEGDILERDYIDEEYIDEDLEEQSLTGTLEESLSVIEELGIEGYTEDLDYIDDEGYEDLEGYIDEEDYVEGTVADEIGYFDEEEDYADEDEIEYFDMDSLSDIEDTEELGEEEYFDEEIEEELDYIDEEFIGDSIDESVEELEYFEEIEGYEEEIEGVEEHIGELIEDLEDYIDEPIEELDYFEEEIEEETDSSLYAHTPITPYTVSRPTFKNESTQRTFKSIEKITSKLGKKATRSLIGIINSDYFKM